MVDYLYILYSVAHDVSSTETTSNFCSKLEPEYYTDWTDRDNSLEAIREIRKYIDMICRHVLRAVRRYFPGRRVRKLPCWSARRWKSLT